ncbi:MAG: hypothetical protein RLZZ323_236 [Bacteroidota bacterium]|jgi:hypothetical protein
MCKTYNTIGSLRTLKFHLEKNNIHDFKSLNEVINFQKSYTTLRQQLISYHENLIEQEKHTLSLDLPILYKEVELQRLKAIERCTTNLDKLKHQLQLLNNISPTNSIQKLFIGLKHWNYKRKIKSKEYSFEKDVESSLVEILDEYNFKNARYHFISNCFNEAVSISSHLSISEIDRKKEIIDRLNSFIYGALGEQKVVKTLQSLSDEYFLINDFDVSFSKAIYNRQENDYIKSVQIDHILVGPSGIFLIETKNWSEKSINSINLRSPVEQIKRTSFALFYLLNNGLSSKLRLNKHHWGTKKVSIKNLIVLINSKPNEEFQYVKILTVKELMNYINYFKPIYSSDETSKIAEKILEMNGNNIR